MQENNNGYPNEENTEANDLPLDQSDNIEPLAPDAEDDDVIFFDGRKNEPTEPEISDESGDTRDFEPVNQPADTDGSTKTFDTVDDIKNDKKDDKKDKSKDDGANSNEKTAKAAKATAKGAWFIVRKVLTYLLNIFLTVLIVGIITGTVVALAFLVYIKNYVDPEYTGLDNLKFDSALSTTMYYVDDSGTEVLLEEDTLVSSENRLWADYEDIPQYLIDAYVAVEDQRFWEHDGVDTTRTASAIYNFFIPTSSNYGGGSTITQQLIKNVSGENAATIQRKVQEIFRAMNVEEKYTKEEILEMYLNTIFLSHNSYGVRVAAQTYFGKELQDLTLTECAAIASIGKWPTHYDPISNPNNNLTRRNLVLKLMLEQGKITEEEFNEAYDKPLKLADGTEESYTENVHSYYIDAVMDDVIDDLMETYGYDKATASRVLYSGGLQIVTCLDPDIQACVEKVYTDSSYWPEMKGMQAQSAICIMDPKTGDIVAMCGGLGEKRESRGLNRVNSYRQSGSSIKPLSIYAYGLDNGYYTAGSVVDDVPPVYNEETGSYWPRASTYRGLVSLDYAIRVSLNTVPVKAAMDMGIQNVYENFKDYGYTTLVDSKTLANGTVVSDINTSSMALGGMTYGVTIREHTQAYATLANGGMTSKSRTYSVVRDNTGKIILENREKHEYKYKESTAATITDLLTGVVSESYGTAYSYVNIPSKLGVQVAGKTGTTNDKKDVWFSGYTPDFVACCWYGYDNNKVITASGNCAAQLWNSVFTEIYTYMNENGVEYTSKFEIPSSVTEVEYCILSGKRATDACRNDILYKQSGSARNSCIATGLFAIYDAPGENDYCDKHVMLPYDKVTGAICVEGYCHCPAENIEYYGFRKMSIGDREMHNNLSVLDAGSICVDLPEGYILPDSMSVPYYNNLFGETNFGSTSSEYRYNEACLVHTKPAEPEPPTDPEIPSDPNNPSNPTDPTVPTEPTN